MIPRPQTAAAQMPPIMTPELVPLALLGVTLALGVRDTVEEALMLWYTVSVEVEYWTGGVDVIVYDSHD
jgi:hypothetical protein